MGFSLKQILDEQSDFSIFFEQYAGSAAVFSYRAGKVKILRVNSKYQMEILLNKPIQEFLESDPWDNHGEYSKNKYEKAILDAIETREEIMCDSWRVISSKCCGESKICVRSYIKLIGQEADTYYIYATVHNITDEKISLIEVSDSEKRFRLAAEQINVYAWEYTVATKEMRPCYRCMRDLGLPALLKNYPEPVIDMGIFPQDYADMYRDWHRQVEQGVEYLEAVIPLTIDRVPFRVRYTTEFDENGVPVKAYGSAALELSDNEQAIRNEQLVGTLSQDFIDVFVVDLDRDEATFVKSSGFLPHEYENLLNKKFSYYEQCVKFVEDMVHPEDRDEMLASMKPEVISKELAEHGKFAMTYKLISRGETHYYQFKYYPLDGESTCVLGTVNVDAAVAKQKASEEMLEKALIDAKRANAAKTTFLSHMSHDIRTPLNGIIGLIEMEERHPDDFEMVKDNRKKAKVAADYLLSLINDVLELSKMEDENVVLANDPFDIAALAEDVLTIIGLRALESGITVNHGEISKKFIKPYVYGSPLHVRQIILNILGNAVKYNKPGGSVDCEITCIEHKKEEVVYRCTISDTGIGMDADYLEHIFEPFSQEKQDAKSVFQGTGLGMSIVKALVEKMNGTIEVESEVGVGSKFTVVIPFKLADASLFEEKEDKALASIEGIRLMLAEDNQLNMMIAKLLLEDAGAVVTPVCDGQEALDTFINHAPDSFDAILMDVMMPGMGGLEATGKIRELDRADAKTIPIIAMTANAFAEDRKQAMDAGMTSYITKPLRGDEVVATIAKSCVAK